METALDTKQLSFAPQQDSRLVDLKIWMIRNGLTFVKIGKVIGVTGEAAQQMLKQNRLSLGRHKELLSIGIPGHLLPAAQEIRRGRPSKV